MYSQTNCLCADTPAIKHAKQVIKLVCNHLVPGLIVPLTAGMMVSAIVRIPVAAMSTRACKHSAVVAMQLLVCIKYTSGELQHAIDMARETKLTVDLVSLRVR